MKRASFFGALAILSACSSPSATTSTGSGGSSSSTSTTHTATSATTTSSASSGTGGAGGGPPCTPIDFVPTPGDIQFQAVNPIPSGDLILFNDWNSAPNSVWAMTPDGMTFTEIFRAFRVWSMGVSNAFDKIAFASGDPQQKQHFCLDIGDAIQNTFLYDVASQSAKLLSHGNINDECHTFAPGDQTLYLCRRYDFMADGSNKGYRIGKIDLASLAFTFITAENPAANDLYPAPTHDGLSLLFTEAPVPTGQRSLLDRTLSTNMDVLLRSNVNQPVISPDGTRYAYQDYGMNGAVRASDLNGQNTVTLANEQGSGMRWSPDGTTVIFTVFDSAKSCAHIDMVKSDGSQAAAPTRIYDCGAKGRFITDLAYIHRP